MSRGQSRVNHRGHFSNGRITATWVAGQFDCGRIPGWKRGGSGRIFRGWRQLFNAIAAPSTDALKRSSWYRIQVTRSARSAGRRWSRGGIAPTFPHTNLLNVQTESRNDEPPQTPQRPQQVDHRHCDGNPDAKHISTSYVERSNLTVRMHMRRFTRLTNAFSKKVENHAAAIALHSMYYNSSASIRRSRSHPLWLLAFRPSLGKLQALASFRKCPILLEQWELANFKPQYNFVVRQYAIGKGHSVSLMWRGGKSMRFRI